MGAWKILAKSTNEPEDNHGAPKPMRRQKVWNTLSRGRGGGGEHTPSSKDLTPSERSKPVLGPGAAGEVPQSARRGAAVLKWTTQ